MWLFDDTHIFLVGGARPQSNACVTNSYPKIKEFLKQST